VKYALHCESHRSVVLVDGSGVVCSAGWSESLSGGEQRFDGFVSENEQRGDRPEAGGQRLLAACLADATDHLLAAEFLQIIGSMAGPVLRWCCLLRARTRAARSEAVKPSGDAVKAITASSTRRIRGLLRSIPPTLVLPTCEEAGRRSNSSSAMKH
jgi:hypothetical protein